MSGMSNTSQIADCLQTLDKPSVLLTSEDGMRWYLSIFQGGKQHVRLCHEFGLLGTGNDEWEEETDEEEQCAAGICQFDDDFEQLAFLWDEDEAARVAAEEQAEIADYVAGKQIVSEQEEFGCTLPSDLVQQLTNETDGKRACQVFLTWQHQTIHDLLTEWKCGVRSGGFGWMFRPPPVYRAGGRFGLGQYAAAGSRLGHEQRLCK